MNFKNIFTVLLSLVVLSLVFYGVRRSVEKGHIPAADADSELTVPMGAEEDLFFAPFDQDMIPAMNGEDVLLYSVKAGGPKDYVLRARNPETGGVLAEYALSYDEYERGIAPIKAFFADYGEMLGRKTVHGPDGVKTVQEHPNGTRVESILLEGTITMSFPGKTPFAIEGDRPFITAGGRLLLVRTKKTYRIFHLEDLYHAPGAAPAWEWPSGQLNLLVVGPKDDHVAFASQDGTVHTVRSLL